MEELCRESFDVTSWLNRNLGRRDADGLLDDMREEWGLAHEELSRSLGEALGVVPKSVREAEKVRQMGSTLMEEVNRASRRVEGVETGADEAVAAIANADAVLRRVESARDMLARVADIDTLLDRIEAIFVGGDLLAAADTIAKIRDNIEALKNVPEMSEKREALDAADKRLNSMAEPKLTSALETKSTSGTQAALQIFHKSGREDAFLGQYVQSRASYFFRRWREIFVGSEAEAVNAMYTEFTKTIQEEAAWLQEAVPELRPRLVPALVLEVFSLLEPPMKLELPRGIDADGKIAIDTDESFSSNGILAARLARTVAKLCMENEKYVPDMEMVATACDSVFAPVRAYVDNFPLLERILAVNNVKYSLWKHVENPTLEQAVELVKDASEHLVQSGSETAKRCLDSTKGVLLGASFEAQKSAAVTFASRAEKLIKSTPPVTSSGWMAVQSSLSFLTTVASLVRSWAEMKDSFATEAVICAMPLIEVASGATDKDEEALAELVGAQSDIDAMVIWSLMRNKELRLRAVSALQTYESAISDRSGGDLRTLLKYAQEFVYNCLFRSIHNALNNLHKARDWNAETQTDDNSNDLPEFSVTPMRYATEIGEHLLTIPQQLEPYIPDEEDAALAIPPTAGDSEVNFARQWITAIGQGTLDLYVEKILSLSRISSGGASQLAVDLEYVCSVLSALGESMSMAVTGVRAVLEVDHHAIAETVRGLESSDARRAAAKAAELRGVHSTY